MTDGPIKILAVGRPGHVLGHIFVPKLISKDGPSKMHGLGQPGFGAPRGASNGGFGLKMRPLGSMKIAISPGPSVKNKLL